MQLPVLIRRKRSNRAARRHPGRQFADLYEGNPGYNARAYRSAGRPFVVVKASEGLHHIDALHAIRCEESHAVGCPVGHYHYFSPGISPAGQAQHFWGVVRNHFLTVWPGGHGHDETGRHNHTDFLIVDIERGSGGWIDPKDELDRFDSNLRRITGNRLLVGYSENSFLREHGLQVASRKWWVASYPTFPGRLGRKRILWAHQYSNHEHFHGISPPVDASVLIDRSSIRYWDAQQV